MPDLPIKMINRKTKKRSGEGNVRVRTNNEMHKDFEKRGTKLNRALEKIAERKGNKDLARDYRYAEKTKKAKKSKGRDGIAKKGKTKGTNR